MRIAVVGATGYAGLEVLRLAASHPDFEVVLATGESNAGRSVAEHAPALAGLYPDMIFEPTPRVFDVDIDVAFVALPHGKSQAVVPDLRRKGVAVVDLGADFRLKDAADYDAWYGASHTAPALLADAVYGLVERHRDELLGAKLIAVPGCYPTASSLALGPFLDRGLVEPAGIIVNAMSGVSGAGRATSDRLHFSIEIQREIEAEVLFTPHLVPVARGMLVSAYARVVEHFTSDEALRVLRATYENDPFIVVSDEPPTLKDPVGSNLCFISARVDDRTRWLVVMSSLDNLIKGAAGQAIQAWNVANGLDETRGLPRSGVTP
jgi:N-acetyl-gamma-glutamyl-phosphate reductase